MAKEFNKKFMHPTRRKLVDMVLHGKEYEKEAFVSFAGAEEEKVTRAVGERWTDKNGKSWEQLEAGRIEVSELGDTMAEVRAYLDRLNTCKGEACNTIKPNRVDKKLISKTGYCTTCLAKKETLIKTDGLWQAYEDYKMYSNMIPYGKDIIEQFKQAYRDCKQEYDMVNEDGTIEKWRMERDVEEMKAEILADITKYEAEIEQVTKLRNEAWEKLKHKNYDLVRPLND